MRHQFSAENTSYAATYGNWVQVYDDFSGEKIWCPFSAHQAGFMARSSAQEFPWSAPAGFNRGLLTTSSLDLAINPNQKQRDELYKVNINPVMFSPSQGMVVFGQKTLSKKPSAFDRINVRRLFQVLERPTKKVSQFFIFEPNNEFTRTRVVNTLTPLFEYAKQNGGVYDYLIVCDERNNTAMVIDNNELKIDILLKPTRTAEFILVSFTATRTDANFDEIL
jgi:phage tail sheath protein FI